MNDPKEKTSRDERTDETPEGPLTDNPLVSGPITADEDETTRDDAPIADLGDASRPMSNTDRPADGLGTTPSGIDRRAAAERGEIDVDATDGDPAAEPLDFTEGEMHDVDLTQGETVVDAEYMDRGPAQLDSGVDADGAADIADTEDGDVATTIGVRTVEDAGIPEDDAPEG